jgi:hypothetical protein
MMHREAQAFVSQLGGPSIEDAVRKYEFKLADALIEESTSRILEISTLEKELEVVPTLAEVKEFFALC